MKTPPILIAAPTRCGTTMISWLLHLHGVWIGEGKVTKAPETNPQVATENTAITEYLKGVAGSPADFRGRIEALVETDGRWLVKTTQVLLRWRAWAEHFPEARWLLPVRSIEAIVASKMRHPGMARHGVEAHRRTTREHQAMQTAVAQSVRHSRMVNADGLCTGDEQEAREAVEFCGLAFDPALYHGWVKPELWHGS